MESDHSPYYRQLYRQRQVTNTFLRAFQVLMVSVGLSIVLGVIVYFVAHATLPRQSPSTTTTISNINTASTPTTLTTISGPTTNAPSTTIVVTTSTTTISCGTPSSTNIIFLSSLLTIESTSFTQYQYNFSATGTTATVSFSFSSGNKHLWYLDNVSIQHTGTEMLTNGDFENGMSFNGWTHSCSGSCASVTNTTSQSGSQSYINDCAYSSADDTISQTFASVIGDVYSLSFYLEFYRTSPGVGSGTDEAFIKMY
ncbi:unnamed protein product [Didymodactylos carnosus]|uniref:Uncharacterized protein n=1 Tax=Didymodactylos carnosus TaxID=1234261 RepID=A0A814REN8_9BILA|nr:unnamed protein product [Didymodactylos carnosus]CAF1132911.1 unnamed protein product [Didymodactylos carnosus]CAF3588079.1 unnamed protein product [Didymodactylos carnosus]CAF3896716.1 unnamed protein product [Didymodactylos carnosus]